MNFDLIVAGLFSCGRGFLELRESYMSNTVTTHQRDGKKLRMKPYPPLAANDTRVRGEEVGIRPTTNPEKPEGMRE